MYWLWLPTQLALGPSPPRPASGCTRRVTQPRPGVDDAVEDVLDACHGGAQGVVVEDVPVVVFDVEVVDAFVELVRRINTRTASPRATSWRVTWEPTKPLAPTTNSFAPVMG